MFEEVQQKNTPFHYFLTVIILGLVMDITRRVNLILLKIITGNLVFNTEIKFVTFGNVMKKYWVEQLIQKYYIPFKNSSRSY